MRLKLLITAGLALFLSKFASPNECARHSAKCGSDPVQTTKPAPKTATADNESSTLVINKLLYI